MFYLEVLKFVFNVKKKTIQNCFNQYFQPVVQIHNYSTGFAVNILAVFSKFWNEMPENIKSSSYLSHSTLVYRVKQNLKGNLN